MTSLEHDFASSFVVRFQADTAYFHGTFWRFANGQWAEWPFELLRAHIAGRILSDRPPHALTMTDMTDAKPACLNPSFAAGHRNPLKYRRLRSVRS